MTIPQHIQERMEIVPWSISLTNGQIQFHPGRTTPEGYDRPSFWHHQFFPRIWHEEIPKRWQTFYDRLIMAVRMQNYEQFEVAYFSALVELYDYKEFFHHVRDYLSIEDNLAFDSMYSIFEESALYKEQVAERGANVSVSLKTNPDLVLLATQNDYDECVRLILRLEASDQAYLVIETLIFQVVMAEGDGCDTLIPAAIDALGNEQFNLYIQTTLSSLEEEWKSQLENTFSTM